MPHVGRQAIKQEAFNMRAVGEQVTLLIAPASTPTTATPFDPVLANSAVDDSAATRVPIYAFVRWHDKGTVSYEAGGRSTNSKADIETTSEWLSYLVQAYAVQLEDGSIFRKCAEKYSETRAIYTLVVEGVANIAQ
jgi:hypothetical protein